jgi:hypothetical protein
VSTPPTSGKDAQEAIRRSERKLEDARSKTTMIDRLAERLARFAEENNFAHRMRDLYREGT